MKPNEASDKFRSYMRLKHLALSTEQSYLAWLARYMRFLAEAGVEAMTGEQKVEAFLSDLPTTQEKMDLLEQACLTS